MWKIIWKLLFIALIIWGIRKSGIEFNHGFRSITDAYKLVMVKSEMQTIGNAILSSYALGGPLPDQYGFSSWVKQNITSRAKPADEDLWGRPYCYLCGQDSFKIFSDGPDKTPSQDDIEMAFAIKRRAEGEVGQ